MSKDRHDAIRPTSQVFTPEEGSSSRSPSSPARAPSPGRSFARWKPARRPSRSAGSPAPVDGSPPRSTASRSSRRASGTTTTWIGGRRATTPTPAWTRATTASRCTTASRQRARPGSPTSSTRRAGPGRLLGQRRSASRSRRPATEEDIGKPLRVALVREGATGAAERPSAVSVRRVPRVPRGRVGGRVRTTTTRTPGRRSVAALPGPSQRRPRLRRPGEGHVLRRPAARRLRRGQARGDQGAVPRHPAAARRAHRLPPGRRS